MKGRTDANRQRRLQEYKPLEATREERAMEYHEKMQKQWKAQAEHLSKVTGRDPSTLAMFSEDEFVRANEERFLISQVAFALASKDMGAWSPLPRIGDLYAQRENASKRLKNFEIIGNPENKESEKVPGQRPTGFMQSKYYKKRAKQLKSYIEKMKPYTPEFEGLVVVGEPWPNKTQRQDFIDETDDTQEEGDLAIEEGTIESTVKVSMDSNRLFFKTKPGAAKSKSIVVSNVGTTAVYYKWEVAKDVELMIGAGSSRTPVKKEGQGEDPFDWRESEQFDLPRNVGPRKRSEFSFSQLEGSILPGCSKTFDFAFSSHVPGCFTQRWVMRTTPVAKSEGSLSVSLRGCCEVEPPQLKSFKQSIENSLHESERTRCIDEIIASVFERVSNMCAMKHKSGEERIDGDLLVDDRAPAFEEMNKKWGLVYSPGLYSSLLKVAEKCWDLLGVTGFDRFWDMSIESLTKMAMSIGDGQAKRAILKQINVLVEQNMTASAAGNPTFSLAYIQLASFLNNVQIQFGKDAAANGKELPLFVVPKVQDSGESEEMESTRKKHRAGGKRDRKPPPKKPAKKGKNEGDSGRDQAAPGPEVTEYTPELKEAMKQTIISELKKSLRAFEHLAGESSGVGQQLTRVNEIERLDTNLDVEVEDDDI